jgi:hypothetical protein
VNHYTSAKDILSKVPEGENTLNHIRRFFVNDWFEKPYVFFIASQNMENSWYACLEVGQSVLNQYKRTKIPPPTRS